MTRQLLYKILQNEHVVHNFRNFKWSLITIPVVTVISQKFAQYIPAEETKKKSG